MRKKILRSMTVLSVFAVAFAALAASLVPPRGNANAPNAAQGQEKKLREIAMERDVEVEGFGGCHLSDMTLNDLIVSSSAIVYVQIVDSRAYFDDSGDPMDGGQYIET